VKATGRERAYGRGGEVLSGEIRAKEGMPPTRGEEWEGVKRGSLCAESAQASVARRRGYACTVMRVRQSPVGRNGLLFGVIRLGFPY
jgi:hypothetical protein